MKSNRLAKYGDRRKGYRSFVCMVYIVYYSFIHRILIFAPFISSFFLLFSRHYTRRNTHNEKQIISRAVSFYSLSTRLRRRDVSRRCQYSSIRNTQKSSRWSWGGRSSVEVKEILYTASSQKSSVYREVHI